MMGRYGVPAADRGERTIVRYRELLRALSTVKDADPELIELQARAVRRGAAGPLRGCGGRVGAGQCVSPRCPQEKVRYAMRSMGREFSLRVHLRAGDAGGTGALTWGAFVAALRSLGLRPSDGVDGGSGPGTALALRDGGAVVGVDTRTGEEMGGAARGRAGFVFDASAMEERTRCGATRVHVRVLV